MAYDRVLLVVESDDLYRKTKKQLGVLGIRTFRGLARRKRGTLLKQIPNMSPQELRSCEAALRVRGLDFVPDATISLLKYPGIKANSLFALWKRGITSWDQLRKLNQKAIIGKPRVSIDAFRFLEKLAIELGYKPPQNEFRELGISNLAQEWLFKKCRIFSINDLRESKFGFSYCFIRTGTFASRYRREVLYRLWQHGIKLPHSKDI